MQQACTLARRGQVQQAMTVAEGSETVTDTPPEHRGFASFEEHVLFDHGLQFGRCPGAAHRGRAAAAGRKVDELERTAIGALGAALAVHHDQRGNMALSLIHI